VFTAWIGAPGGAVRIRGHLDRLGAEALCRTVSALRQPGRRQIVLQLGSATADDDALAVLGDLASSLRTEGVLLLFQ